jgi:hypothetical protein
MRFRTLVALFLVITLVCSAAAQGPAAADALYRQAAEREMGAAKDTARAARLYADAARQGHTPSMVRLGYLLQSGAGVTKDPPQAFSLFMQAANAGNPDGRFMLALTYLQGVGTTKNPVEARKLLLDAAGQQHQYAQYLLAGMLESGEGGRATEAGARRWYDRAAGGADSRLAARAAAMRDRIDKLMLAPDNRNGYLVTAILLMALAGTIIQGLEGNSPGSFPGSPSSPGVGGGPSSSPPPCRPVPIPMIGNSMTANGRTLSNPGQQMMMGGC